MSPISKPRRVFSLQGHPSFSTSTGWNHREVRWHGSLLKVVGFMGMVSRVNCVLKNTCQTDFHQKHNTSFFSPWVQNTFFRQLFLRTKSLVVGSGSGWLWIAHWQGGWWLDFFDGKRKLRGDPKGPNENDDEIFSQPIMACKAFFDRVCRIKPWNFGCCYKSRAEIQKDSRSHRFCTPF